MNRKYRFYFRRHLAGDSEWQLMSEQECTIEQARKELRYLTEKNRSFTWKFESEPIVKFKIIFKPKYNMIETDWLPVYRNRVYDTIAEAQEVVQKLSARNNEFVFSVDQVGGEDLQF